MTDSTILTDRALKMDVPEGEYTVEIGRAKVVREGEHVTCVSYGAMLFEAIAAAEELRAQGVEVEIVDLRTLWPVDADTVVQSVKKTGRLVVVHEASRARDSRHRRRLGIRNTLWTLWLRRPLRSALRRSFAIVGSAPKDAATLGAVTDALRGALWVARHRQVVPDRVEYGLVLLEEDQKRSPARRYIG